MSDERIEDVIADLEVYYPNGRLIVPRLTAALERERAATRKVAADLMRGSEEAAAMDFPGLSRQLGDFAAELRRIAGEEKRKEGM